MSLGSSLSAVTRLRAERPRDHGSIPGMCIKLTNTFHLLSKLRMSGVMPSFVRVPSCHSQIQLYFTRGSEQSYRYPAVKPWIWAICHAAIFRVLGISHPGHCNISRCKMKRSVSVLFSGWPVPHITTQSSVFHTFAGRHHLALKNNQESSHRCSHKYTVWMASIKIKDLYQNWLQIATNSYQWHTWHCIGWFDIFKTIVIRFVGTGSF